MMTVNTLTYFTVTGHWWDVEGPPLGAGTVITPQFEPVSAFVTFTPRLRPGTAVIVANLDLGVTLQQSNLTAVPSTTGGTFAAGTKFWVFTATDANGETTASNEVTATLTGSTSSVALSWPQVDGAAGYKIYRGTAANTENVLVATIGSGSTLTYLDTGTAGSAATPPVTNTAELSANTAVPMAPITARILNGELQTIDQNNTPKVQLLANSSVIGLSSLIYDVSFTKVVYAGAAQILNNFAFTAPTTATTIDLTDPALTRLAYDPTNYG
jgi:hypothetical protein